MGSVLVAGTCLCLLFGIRCGCGQPILLLKAMRRPSSNPHGFADICFGTKSSGSGKN